MLKVRTPPIKSQGIKTKLIPWIASAIPDQITGRWIEPFLGTGAVALNLAPPGALLADLNPHLINFYKALADGSISPIAIKEYLESEGARLLARGESHYYAIRERFNAVGDPLDFLFVNRAGFNGMIRFNRKGGFNIPFCRKPNRFAQAYVTKIVNQTQWAYDRIQENGYEFVCQGFEETIKNAEDGDFIYCDPPYIDRHVDYYSKWNEEIETTLCRDLENSGTLFMLSSWHHNDYRKNAYMDTLWSRYNIMTREHFYHVGAKESNRSPMIEALVTNYAPTVSPDSSKALPDMPLFEDA